MLADSAVSDTNSLPPIVLLLDDERDILEMYSAHFEAEGVWVATAASAREGLTAVEELRPDLIVTDIGFGGEPSGATFAQALKERRETSGIPLIVLTGLGSLSAKAGCAGGAATECPAPVGIVARLAGPFGTTEGESRASDGQVRRSSRAFEDPGQFRAAAVCSLPAML
jgi:CheY-like chemotaxis protein